MLNGAIPAESVDAGRGSIQFSSGSQRPDFSGTWELDRSNSRIQTQFGLAGLRNPAPDVLYITQRGGEMAILSSRIPGSEPRAYEFDSIGYLPAIEGQEEKILLRSSIRGLSMISEGGGRVAGEMVRVREVLQISSTGRQLRLDVTTTIGGEELTNVLLYRRAGS